MHAPVAVHDLRDSEIDGDRHQRDGLVLVEATRRHQEVAHLAERVPHREIDGGLLVDLALGVGAELREIVRVAEAVQHPLVLCLEQRVVQSGQRRPGQRVLLAQIELEGAGQRALDGGARQLGVALGGVGIADREERAGHGHRVVHRRALSDAPVVDVAADVVRWNGVDHVGFARRQAHHAEVRADRDPHVLEHAVPLLHGAVIDGHARIVDDLVHDAGRIGLRRPAVVVHGSRPVLLAGRVDLVDRDDLARLRLGEQLLVVEAPPGGGVAPEALALVRGIGAGPRAHVDDAHLEDVARLGAAHGHRPRAHVDAEAFAGAAAEQRRLHRTGAATIDTLALAVPVKDALGAGITLHHALGVVVGVMRERLDGDEVSAIDLDQRLQRLAEVAPVNGLVGGRDVVMVPRARHHARRHPLGLRELRRGERADRGAEAAQHDGRAEKIAAAFVSRRSRAVCHWMPPHDPRCRSAALASGKRRRV